MSASSSNLTLAEKREEDGPLRDVDNAVLQQQQEEKEEERGNESKHTQLSPSPPFPELQPTQSNISKPSSLTHEILFISLLCMSQLMTQASLGQTIAPLHIIGSTFNISNPGQLSWFAAAYSLTVGTFILIAGRLGDVFGHRKFFIAGFIWFGFWSLIAGFSAFVKDSPIFFNCCRALQGIGPAFLLPNSLAILGRTYEPGRRKEMVFCLFGATAPTGFVLGAVFSSIFAQFAWWPWAFWTGGIVCIVLGLAGYWIIPNTPPPVFNEKEEISLFVRIDATGSIAGVIALILINFSFNQGPVVGWPTPYVYIILIIGFVFLGLFAWIESKARFPLLPRSALTADTAYVLGCIAAGWSSFGIWVYYLWQIIEELRHVSPLLASAQIAPAMISGLIAAITTGKILHRFPPSVCMMISMLAFTTGVILIATMPVGQTYWIQTFLSIIITPWGMDMSFPAATILLSDRMGKEYQGVSASLVNTVVNYSISIGLGFAALVESRVNDGGITPAELLSGFRAALYTGIGLSALGVMVAFVFGGTHVVKSRRAGKTGTAGEV